MKTILRYLSIPVLIPFIWILKLIHYIQMKIKKADDTEEGISSLKLALFIQSLHNYMKGKDPDILEVSFTKRYKDGKWYSYDYEHWGRKPTEEEFNEYVENLIAQGVEGEEDECTYCTKEDWEIYDEVESFIYAVYKARENRKIANNEKTSNGYIYDEDLNEITNIETSNPRKALEMIKKIVEEDENPDEIMAIYNITK